MAYGISKINMHAEIFCFTLYGNDDVLETNMYL